MTPLAVFALLICCYLVGAFPTAYIIGKLNGVNIFEKGSGNMGANNVMRVLGAAWGVITWLIDASKGLAAVLMIHVLIPQGQFILSIVGALAAVIGHDWSVFALLITGKLRGGKGAATSGGTWLALNPAPIVAVTMLIWGALLAGTRYMSLAVLVSFTIGTLVTLALVLMRLMDPLYSVYSLSISALVYLRHLENIKALLAGRERRFGERAS